MKIVKRSLQYEKMEQHNQGEKYKFLLKQDRKRSVSEPCVGRW